MTPRERVRGHSTQEDAALSVMTWIRDKVEKYARKRLESLNRMWKEKSIFDLHWKDHEETFHGLFFLPLNSPLGVPRMRARTRRPR